MGAIVDVFVVPFERVDVFAVAGFMWVCECVSLRLRCILNRKGAHEQTFDCFRVCARSRFRPIMAVHANERGRVFFHRRMRLCVSCEERCRGGVAPLLVVLCYLGGAALLTSTVCVASGGAGWHNISILVCCCACFGHQF